jgi:hypothetical protein
MDMKRAAVLTRLAKISLLAGCLTLGGAGADSLRAQSPGQMPPMTPEMQKRIQEMMQKRQQQGQQRGGKEGGQPQVKPPGVPVPLDSPLYAAYRALEQQAGYRVHMNLISNDPRVAQMAAAGVGMKGAPEMAVRGNTREVIMHMSIPATDVPNTIDDWEIHGLVQNGRAARLITSPAVPRLMKLADEKLAMQMAMLNAQASSAVARAAAQGPLGMISAAMTAAQTALADVEAPRLLQKAKDMFTWQCMPSPAGQQDGGEKTAAPLTDLKAIGDQAVDGTAATAYEFYVRNGDNFQGPVHLLVAKDSGLPLRLEMIDPQGRGGVQMNYDVTKAPDIEIPPCLAGGQ